MVIEATADAPLSLEVLCTGPIPADLTTAHKAEEFKLNGGRLLLLLVLIPYITVFHSPKYLKNLVTTNLNHPLTWLTSPEDAILTIK